MILLSYISGGSQLTGWRVKKIEKTPRWFWGCLAVFWLVQLLLIGAVWSLDGVSPLLRVLLVAILVVGAVVPVASMVFRARMAGQRMGSAPQQWAMGFMAILLVPLMAWMMSSILWPATPSRIKRYVESFDQPPLKWSIGGTGKSWRSGPSTRSLTPISPSRVGCWPKKSLASRTRYPGQRAARRTAAGRSGRPIEGL